MLLEVKELYQRYNNDIHRRLGIKETLEKKLKECESRISEIETTIDRVIKASSFLQTLSDTTRQQVVDKISAIVTDALQKVKDPNLEFKMNLSTERNQIDLKFVVYDKTTKREYDILNSCGGSIADIVTFPLRVSLLMKWDPVLARLMILDENFKFVSTIDQESLAEFVQQISEKLNLQTLLVTHSERFSAKAHKIFHVSKQNGISKVEVKPS